MAWSGEGRDWAAAARRRREEERRGRAGGERGAQSQPRRHCSRAPNSGGGGGGSGGGGGGGGGGRGGGTTRPHARPRTRRASRSLRRRSRGRAGRARGGGRRRLGGASCGAGGLDSVGIVSSSGTLFSGPIILRFGRNIQKLTEGGLENLKTSDDFRATFQQPSQFPFSESRASNLGDICKPASSSLPADKWWWITDEDKLTHSTLLRQREGPPAT